VRKPDLLQIIEAQISQWDCGISGRARDFLLNLIMASSQTGNPVDIAALQMPCQDITRMAKVCLAAFTNYHEDDFESVSDCLQMKSIIPKHTTSPQYVEALFDVLASSLFTTSHIEDGSADLASNEAGELARHLEALDQVIESRSCLERDMLVAAQAEKNARAETSSRHRKKMQVARAERTSNHDWAAVAKLEADLLAAGKPERNLAGIIEKRLGIPQNTYRDWRRRKTTV
jgi:hypothetical protein